MATFLCRIGCTYDTASNGLMALEKYKSSSQSRQYDFVLMGTPTTISSLSLSFLPLTTTNTHLLKHPDISMPIMDGLVSTSKIRQYEKDNSLKSACIMAVTGVASDSMQQQALAAGINDYLIKPLSLSGLKRLMSIA